MRVISSVRVARDVHGDCEGACAGMVGASEGVGRLRRFGGGL